MFFPLNESQDALEQFFFTLVGSQDYTDQKISEKAVKQEDDCSVEYTYEGDDETEDSSTERRPKPSAA